MPLVNDAASAADGMLNSADEMLSSGEGAGSGSSAVDDMIDPGTNEGADDVLEEEVGEGEPGERARRQRPLPPEAERR